MYDRRQRDAATFTSTVECRLQKGPPGVGLGMKPQLYLKEGDVMRLEIDGLGVQQQTCVRGGTS